MEYCKTGGIPHKKKLYDILYIASFTCPEMIVPFSLMMVDI